MTYSDGSDSGERKPQNLAAAALKAVFDNNWFYVACIELWGIYVRLPLPHLPTYLYLPPLFVLCYALFFIWELSRIKKEAKRGIRFGTGACGSEAGKGIAEITGKEFVDGLARVMTSKSSYLIAALCSIPPYWLAEYYYGRYSFGIVVNGIVMLLSFAAVFAFLAYRRARKMWDQRNKAPGEPF